MSLKEKAKTTDEICTSLRFQRMMIKRDSPTYESDKKYYNELCSHKWVRFEDAEQALLDRLIPLEQQIDTLQRENQTLCDIIKTEEKEREELKQKLQQWMKEYEEICQDSETDYVRRCSFLEEKFEELLKEV